MVERVESADGTSIAFDRRGAGPAVIIVGGAMMSRTSPEKTVNLLSESFEVFTYDRRGRGDSGDADSYAVAREIEDLQAIIAAAGGSACVFGMSSGGFIALQTAAQDEGVAKVAVYEPPYLTGDGPLSASDYQAQVNAAVAEGHPDHAVELFLRQVSGGWFDESIKSTPWWPGMVALGPSLRYDAALTGDGSVPTTMLGEIRVPVLAAFGGASDAWAKASADAIASAVPDCTVLELEGQDHRVDEAVLSASLREFFAN